MSALHEAVARAIARDLPRCHTTDGALDLNRVAGVAIRLCADVVRDFPLNICGYGEPMPADHAASVEQFREAVLAALAGDDA